MFILRTDLHQNGGVEHVILYLGVEPVVSFAPCSACDVLPTQRRQTPSWSTARAAHYTFSSSLTNKLELPPAETL